MLFEHIRGILARTARGPSGERGVRSIDIALAHFRHLGYTCGCHVADARHFLLPQGRGRLWLWAELRFLLDSAEFWQVGVDCMRTVDVFSICYRI